MLKFALNRLLTAETFWLVEFDGAERLETIATGAARSPVLADATATVPYFVTLALGVVASG